MCVYSVVCVFCVFGGCVCVCVQCGCVCVQCVGVTNSGHLIGSQEQDTGPYPPQSVQLCSDWLLRGGYRMCVCVFVCVYV